MSLRVSIRGYNRCKLIYIICLRCERRLTHAGMSHAGDEQEFFTECFTKCFMLVLRVSVSQGVSHKCFTDHIVSIYCLINSCYCPGSVMISTVMIGEH